MIDSGKDPREIGEALREFEGSQLADTAKVLLEVAERQQNLLERLQKPEARQWVKHKEAAGHFGISESALYEAVKDGAPRHRIVGNVYAYNLAELEVWFK